MKPLFALAALLLALTSVAAEASQSCGHGSHAATMAMMVPAVDAPGCHERVALNAADETAGCDLAAFCALLCGVVAPIGPQCQFAARTIAIRFEARADTLTGVVKHPEAPPPRRVIL